VLRPELSHKKEDSPF